MVHESRPSTPTNAVNEFPTTFGASSPQKNGSRATCGSLRGTITNPFRVKLDEHPDHVLRKMGLIRQKASYFNVASEKYVRFDATEEAWFDESTHEMVDADTSFNTFVAADNATDVGAASAPADSKKRKLSNRVDTVPNSVILVIGDWERSSNVDEPFGCTSESINELQSLLQWKMRSAIVSNGVSDVATPPGATVPVEQQSGRNDASSASRGFLGNLEQVRQRLDNLSRTDKIPAKSILAHDPIQIANLGEEMDGRFLSDAEVSQCIRQYLVRSIPSAAVASGAVLATVGVQSGSIAPLLASGIRFLKSTHDVTALLAIKEKSSQTHEKLETKVKNLTQDAKFLSYEQEKEFEAFSHVVRFEKSEDPEANSTISNQDMVSALHGMILELHRGFHKGRMNEKTYGNFVVNPENPPPCRSAIPVAVVCFGGTDEECTSRELLLCCYREWTVFLIEGSGGFTDKVVAALRLMCDTSLSEAEKSIQTHQWSADLFEIVDRGRLIIVERGQIVDTVAQSLMFSLRRDETLRNAWHKYASWNEAAQSYRHLYVVLLYILVSLGVFATGLSVFQTVMQVVWVSETEHADNSTSVVGRIFSALNLVVIFLPLLIQLMQSVFNKINAGPKWAAFSWAAENCLREIYLSRVQALEYSPESIRAAAQRAAQARREKILGKANDRSKGSAQKPENDDEASAGEPFTSGSRLSSLAFLVYKQDETQLQYSTKQELLSMRLEALTNELMRDVDNVTIKPYDGPLPPKQGIFSGDDGFSDLTNQAYVQLRVEARSRWYKMNAAHVTRVRSVLDFALHFFNTAGTVLGALATYQFLPNTNLQAWVAFTTSVVSALTRIEHWMLYEWKQRKYVQSYMKLDAVLSWWSSRGSLVANASTKSDLCERAERVIVGELIEFRQQLRTASESIKESDENGGQNPGGGSAWESAAERIASNASTLALPDGLKNRRDVARIVKDLSLDLITPENVEAAARDPTSKIAKRLKSLVNELNVEFGDVLGVQKRRMEDLKTKILRLEEPPFTFADIAPMVTDPFGNVVIPRLVNTTESTATVLDVAMSGGSVVDQVAHAAQLHQKIQRSMRVFDLSIIIPRPLQEMIDTAQKRRAFLSELQSTKLNSFSPALAGKGKIVSLFDELPSDGDDTKYTIQLSTIRRAAQAVDQSTVRLEMEHIPTRLLLEVVRLCLHEELIQQFSDSLLTAKLNPQELTPKKLKLSATIEALRPLIFMPWRSLASDDLFTLIDDFTIRNHLQQTLKDSQLRAVLKRLEYFFKKPSRLLTLEEDISSDVILMDVFNELLGSVDGRVLSAPIRQSMRQAVVRDPNVLSKRELISLFHPNLSGISVKVELSRERPSPSKLLSSATVTVAGSATAQEIAAAHLIRNLAFHVETLPQPLLSKFVRLMSQELPGTVCLTASLWRLAHGIATESGVQSSVEEAQRQFSSALAFLQKTEPIFVFGQRADQLAAFILTSSQALILGCRKEQLLKMMAGELDARELVPYLRGMDDKLHQLLCTTHATIGGTFVGEMFDRLAMETMSSCNVSRLLTFEDQVLLVSRLQEFSVSEDLSSETKESILRRIALKPLAAKLSTLTDYQLRDVISRLRFCAMPLFGTGLRDAFVKHLPPKCVAVASQLSPTIWYLLVRTLANIDPRQINLIYFHFYLDQRHRHRFQVHSRSPLDTTSFDMEKVPVEVRQLIPDRDVQDAVMSLDLSIGELKTLCLDCADIAEDRMSIDALERVVAEFGTDPSAIDKIFGCVENVFGAVGRERGVARSYLFTSLLLFIVADDLVDPVEVELKYSRCDPDRLFNHISDIINNEKNGEILQAIVDNDMPALFRAAEREPISALPEASLQRHRFPGGYACPLGDCVPGGSIAENGSEPPWRRIKSIRYHPEEVPRDQKTRVVSMTRNFQRQMQKVHAELHQRLGTLFPTFLSVLLTTIMIHGPTLVFQDVARRHQRQDLKQVFETLPSRMHLSLLGVWTHEGIADVLRTRAFGNGDWRSRLRTYLRNTDVTDSNQETSESNSRPTLSVSRTINDLRELPEDDTFRVLEHLLCTLQRTRIGQIVTLLASEARPRNGSISILSRVAVLKSCVLFTTASIVPLLSTNYFQIAEAFLQFNDKLFYALGTEEKAKAFKTFLLDDAAVAVATLWTETNLGLFFAFMRCRAVSILHQAGSSRDKRNTQLEQGDKETSNPHKSSRRPTVFLNAVVAVSRMAALKKKAESLVPLVSIADGKDDQDPLADSLLLEVSMEEK